MMTPAQVEAFQRTHRNHLGLQLDVDSVLGPETEWSLDFETLSTDRQAIATVAQSFIGLEEAPPGSNDDPHGLIKGWLRRCGAPGGLPWCAAFACHRLSAVRDTRIAGAVRLGMAFQQTTMPMPGDVMWYPTDEQGHGHCGLVIGVSSAEVMTIEGNQRNAVRCLRRPRAARGGTRLRFAVVVQDAEGTVPGVVPSVPLAVGSTR